MSPSGYTKQLDRLYKQMEDLTHKSVTAQKAFLEAMGWEEHSMALILKGHSIPTSLADAVWQARYTFLAMRLSAERSPTPKRSHHKKKAPVDANTDQ